MTREEAIFCEKSYIGETNCTDCKYYGTETCQSRESHKMAVKALEQEVVFDEIRAEIKALSPEPTAYDVVDGNPIKDAVWEIIADVLQIIDKYKGESEG